jgi:predicted transcriptional regulator YdeE
MNIKIEKCTKASFSVVGKEGSTEDGEGFIKKLWNEANTHFNEVKALAKKDEKGHILGVWGLMSNFSRDLKPWEDNLTKGLYLAGVEVVDGAEAPDNWKKWTVPAFEYLSVKVDREYGKVFSHVLNYMKINRINLVAAVLEYNCPEENGQPYLFFPIRKL